jgi:hypothetical protein
MRNLVKFTFVFAFLAVIGFSANAQTDNSTISVGASVFDQISVAGFQDLAIGQVMRNTVKQVDIDETITGDSPSTSGVAVGKFKVFAGAGADVSLDFTSISTLSDGTNTLAIDFNDGTNDLVAWGLGENATGAAVRFSSYGITKVGGNDCFPTNTIDAKNGIYVYVGAKVTASDTQASGNYSGTVTLTATYN